MTANGFRNDQFYGIGNAGEDGGSFAGSNYVVTGANNQPPFTYPAREVITQQSDGRVIRTAMKRGYIRTLISSVQGTGVAIRKCAFQFNPQVLSTSVAMTQDVLNAYQIDIGQFAVPTAGNSNFLFQLFFDRSMELNSSVSHSHHDFGDSNSSDPNNQNIFSGEGALDPSVIGVFRDIGELNSIIGAGLSKEQVSYAQQVAKSQIRAQAIQGGLNPDTDSGVAKALQGSQSFTSSVNYGNTAFLIPQPVRAVFSALFMVEGFVTNVDINYTKFTTSMVPMQATVTLTMNAQYIGYAKKKTYVTDSLDHANDLFIQEKAQSQAAATIALQASVSSVQQYMLGSTGVFTSLGTVLAAQPVQYKFGNRLSPAYTGTSTVNGVQTTLATDPVNQLIAAGSNVSISYTSSINITGPFVTDPRPIGGFGPPLVGPQVLGVQQKLEATSYANAGVAPPISFTTYTQPVPDNSVYYGKYFLIVRIVYIQATVDGQIYIGSGGATTSTKDMFLATTGNPPNTNDAYISDPNYGGSVPIQWVTPTAAPPVSVSTGTGTSTSTILPSVLAVNAATNLPFPGTTSTVGVATRGAH